MANSERAGDGGQVQQPLPSTASATLPSGVTVSEESPGVFHVYDGFLRLGILHHTGSQWQAFAPSGRSLGAAGSQKDAIKLLGEA
jgi:hypothetical protein